MNTFMHQSIKYLFISEGIANLDRPVLQLIQTILSYLAVFDLKINTSNRD